MKLRHAVMTYHPKDCDTVKLSCRALFDVIGVERVFIVGQTDPQIPGCTFIEESKCDTVALPELRDYFVRYHAKYDRATWIYQQLLKMSMPVSAPGLDDTFLVCDADLIFLKNPFAGLPQDCSPWTPSYIGEFHATYREHFKRMMKMEMPAKLSFINHHMVMRGSKLELMKIIISSHTGLRWDDAIISALDLQVLSSFSEYEFYGNMLLMGAPGEMVECPVTIVDCCHVPSEEDLAKARDWGFYALSAQRWRRT